jgi:hypothetical protein
VVLAARGQREVDGAAAPIDDEAEAAAVGRRGRRLVLAWLGVAALLTALAVWA